MVEHGSGEEPKRQRDKDQDPARGEGGEVGGGSAGGMNDDDENGVEE